MGSALSRIGEVVDVALPARSPLGGLLGNLLFGTGPGHVQRREDADAGGGDAEDLGGSGLGETRNARSHCEKGLCCFVCYVWSVVWWIDREKGLFPKLVELEYKTKIVCWGAKSGELVV